MEWRHVMSFHHYYTQTEVSGAVLEYLVEQWFGARRLSSPAQIFGVEAIVGLDLYI
jgi:hypothetical protein